MIVCVCNNVSEEKIIKIVEKHSIIDLESLRDKMSVCNQCCMCEKYINNLLDLITDKNVLACA